MSAFKGIKQQKSSADPCVSLVTSADNVGMIAAGVVSLGKTMHFGEWLKREIEELAMEQKEFAQKAKIPFGTLRVWISQPRPSIRGVNLVRLGKALGKPRDAIEKVLIEAQETAAATPVRQIPVLNRENAVLVLPQQIPIINRVSASQWGERTDLDYAAGHADAYVKFDDPRMFALICDGECMEPDWHDGEYVIFSPRVIEEQGIRDGDDVGVQLYGDGDGKNTFKRAFNDPTDMDVIILRCANHRMKEPDMIVKREQIARIGKAIWAMRYPAARKAKQ